MVDYHAQIVSALKSILPTHYEMVLHSGLKTPCISYIERNNSAVNTGDTVGYSRITYQIKVWDNDIKTIQHYAIEIDNALRPLGWQRVSVGELYDVNSTMIQKIMTYEALFREEY